MAARKDPRILKGDIIFTFWLIVLIIAFRFIVNRLILKDLPKMTHEKMS